MKAFTKYVYGGPEILQMEEVAKPTPLADQILVNVKANSANPADWHILRGKPFFARFSFGLFRPKTKILGADFAGVVVEIGSSVHNFQVGDQVFGESINGGAFAEFLNVPASVCAPMPEAIPFEQMASVPIAGLTALQAIVTHGKVSKGESVLINGSSGGVGHFAVQVAKIYGAEVTAVCSKKNTHFVKEMGADHVIAYDEEDIHAHQKEYDLVLDTHGNLRLEDYRRMGKRGVVVGFTTMGHMITLMVKSLFSKYPLAQFTAAANTEDLTTLASLFRDKDLQVHIEKTYGYHEIPEALGYIEHMHTQGKVAMSWNSP